MIKSTQGYMVGMFTMVLALGQGDGLGASPTAPPSGLTVQADAAGTALSLNGAAPFHRTENEVINERLIDVPGSTIRLALWDEVLTGPVAQTVPFYAISLDGWNMATVRRTSYVLKLRHGDFDLALKVPPVDALLAAT